MIKDRFYGELPSISDISYRNTNDDVLGSRTTDSNRLSWMVFASIYSNDAHKDLIYVTDIFEHSYFLERIKKNVLPEKRFKKFAEELYHAVWGEFYGRSQWEVTVTPDPPRISADGVTELFKESLEYGPTSLNVDFLSAEKISVGHLIFLNWTPFVEYVWNNKKILKGMVKKTKI